MENVHRWLRNIKICILDYGINISNKWLFSVSYQLMSDYREHWLPQYILTRPDFVHHKTSQRESHKHPQFQYNCSTFCLCTLETKLHQRLPVEKWYHFVEHMHIISDVLLITYYVFSAWYNSRRQNCFHIWMLGLTHVEVEQFQEIYFLPTWTDSDMYLGSVFIYIWIMAIYLGPDIFGCIRWPGAENCVEGEF